MDHRQQLVLEGRPKRVDDEVAGGDREVEAARLPLLEQVALALEIGLDRVSVAVVLVQPPRPGNQQEDAGDDRAERESAATSGDRYSDCERDDHDAGRLAGQRAEAEQEPERDCVLERPLPPRSAHGNEDGGEGECGKERLGMEHGPHPEEDRHPGGERGDGERSRRLSRPRLAAEKPRKNENRAGGGDGDRLADAPLCPHGRDEHLEHQQRACPTDEEEAESAPRAEREPRARDEQSEP